MRHGFLEERTLRAPAPLPLLLAAALLLCSCSGDSNAVPAQPGPCSRAELQEESQRLEDRERALTRAGELAAEEAAVLAATRNSFCVNPGTFVSNTSNSSGHQNLIAPRF